MGLSVHRTIRMIEDKTTPPIYTFKADWIINNKTFFGEIRFIDDKKFGQFDIGKFDNVLKLFPNPQQEYNNLKHLVRTAVSDYIKENHKS